MNAQVSRHEISNLTDEIIQNQRLHELIEGATALSGLVGRISVQFMSDEEIRKINRTYRNLNEPTDVLTFPSGMTEPHVIGDIAISIETAKRQAGARGVTLESEIQALVVHGILHIAGFDDVEELDKRTMQAEMHRIGNELGLTIDAEWTSVLHQDVE